MGKGSDGYCSANQGMLGLLEVPLPEASDAQVPRLPAEGYPFWLHEALSLYSQGFSYREISEKLGPSKSTIGRWLKKTGIQIAPPAPNRPAEKLPINNGRQAAISLARERNLAHYESQRPVYRSMCHITSYSPRSDLGNQEHLGCLAEAIMHWHASTKRLVAGFDFEDVLVDSLGRRYAYADKPKHSNNPGRDCSYRKTRRHKVVGISCKSSFGSKVKESGRTYGMSYFMTWEPPPEHFGKKIFNHSQDYQEILCMRRIDDARLPNKDTQGRDIGGGGDAAVRYDLYSLPPHIHQAMIDHTYKPGINLIEVPSKVNPGKTFKFRVKLHQGNKNSVEVYSIPLEEMVREGTIYTPTLDQIT